MTLDFNKTGKVKVSMKDYIESIMEDLLKHMIGKPVTPAASHLFQVRQNNREILPKEESERFHHLVAQLLFLSQHGRPDIRTAISFLLTRVETSRQRRRKEISQGDEYMQQSKHLTLTLDANEPIKTEWWVDAAYAVHPTLKGHTGGILSLGKGAVYATATKNRHSQLNPMRTCRPS